MYRTPNTNDKFIQYLLQIPQDISVSVMKVTLMKPKQNETFGKENKQFSLLTEKSQQNIFNNSQLSTDNSQQEYDTKDYLQEHLKALSIPSTMPFMDKCGNLLPSVMVNSEFHSQVYMKKQNLTTFISSKNDSNKKTKRKINQREFWPSDKFNHFRAQSMLNFNRRQIANFTNRKEKHIYSKVQKHMSNLCDAKKYISEALNAAKNEHSQLIRVDNNTLRGYYFIKKYFTQIYGLWESLDIILSSDAYKEKENAREQLCSFVPKFLQQENLDQQKVITFISQGLYIQQAIESLECISQEKYAHARNGKPLSKRKQRQLKKNQKSLNSVDQVPTNKKNRTIVKTEKESCVNPRKRDKKLSNKESTKSQVRTLKYDLSGSQSETNAPLTPKIEKNFNIQQVNKSFETTQFEENLNLSQQCQKYYSDLSSFTFYPFQNQQDNILKSNYHSLQEKNFRNSCSSMYPINLILNDRNNYKKIYPLRQQTQFIIVDNQHQVFNHQVPLNYQTQQEYFVKEDLMSVQHSQPQVQQENFIHCYNSGQELQNTLISISNSNQSLLKDIVFEKLVQKYSCK